MKKETNNKHRIYLKTLLDLRFIIAQEYDDGGWLSPERIMCEQLNVSRMTYRKVLSWLIAEDIVKSVPRKGHWVLSKDLRCRKIGIIIGNGTESPFISYGNFLARILDCLNENGLKAHLIQASRLENINISAMSHAVEGILWINPPIEAYDHIRQIQGEGIPVISVAYKINEGRPAEGPFLLSDINYVSLDFVQSTIAAAKAMIKHGYRRIIFATSPDYDASQALKSVFTDAGIKFSDDQIISEVEGLEENLDTIRRRLDIDAILSDGGWDRAEQVLNYCHKLPAAQRPDLIMPKADNVVNLYKKYKNVDITGFQIFRNKYLAETAAVMLVKNLNEGTPMCSVLKPAYDIVFESEKAPGKTVVNLPESKPAYTKHQPVYEVVCK